VFEQPQQMLLPPSGRRRRATSAKKSPHSTSIISLSLGAVPSMFRLLAVLDVVIRRIGSLGAERPGEDDAADSCSAIALKEAVRILGHRNEWKVAIELAHVQSVADNKVIGDCEADVLRARLYFVTVRFVQ
jgi:hypothetical protein